MIQRDGHCSSLWQNTEAYQTSSNHQTGQSYDVIIIGGGITGITTALQLQEAGKKCLVLEAYNLCFGTTGGTTAHINTLLDTPYATISKNFGAEGAVTVCQAAKEALQLVKDNIAKYDIDCGFVEAAAYVFSQNDQQSKQLDDLLLGSTDAGLLLNPVAEIPVPIAFEKAIRAEGQAKFNPVKYVFALAHAFENLGGIIMEHCRVQGVNEKDRAEVETTLGNFWAEKVIYATHIPPGVNLVHLRCVPYRSYAMAVILKDNRQIPDLTYDLYDPYRYYRSQKEGDINYLIAGGFDHKTGHEENTDGCLQALEAHVRTHFEVKEVRYRWSSQYYEPADGIAYIGQLPGHSKQVLVATGFGGNGMTYSHIAAITLKHIVLEEESAYIPLFSPGRVKPVAGFVNFITHNAAVAGQLVGQLFSREKLSELAGLAPGEGKVVVYDSKKIAVYKDDNGGIHAVSPTCTHLGCSVAWNKAEQSWDCPCHGARYAAEGAVLNAPASKALEKIDLTAT